MLVHSKAKVALYGDYLETYLAILTNSKYIKKINIFDLMCGEGLYQNNQKGSPLVALEKTKKVLAGKPNFNPSISFIFNDNGQSEIEYNISKINRLKSICNSIDIPENVSIQFRENDLLIAIREAIDIAANSTQTKSLFFVDPYGYKKIKPQFIKDILSNNSSELIVFLPVSHMYRFAIPAMNKKFTGSEPLYLFLLELFGEQIEDFNDVYHFIKCCKNKFQDYLEHQKIFVETFTLQRDLNNTYCLFFFTSNVLGFQKMLEAKWKNDTEQGKGFKLSKQKSLFSGITYSPYPNLLKTYLSRNDSVSNGDLFIFGLKNGYLPKHTKEAINFLKKTGTKITTSSFDDKPIKGYYISYKNYTELPDRLITYKIEQ